MNLLNKRVCVIAGPQRGHRFQCTTYENGLYWSEINDEVIGFEPGELRECDEVAPWIAIALVLWFMAVVYWWVTLSGGWVGL